ncbi:Dioxygenase OS=Streptomyces aurantiogriseus OX=66870 GN=GCM10010251_38980 PE=3 SV=1 [Streptomyces aurantiogriseus]|uniref:Dioxygenase n=1 Tax=Streptomyces aurantiogriseus TaxID=66870 RepID=A0A918CDS8_9ACTN|nr:hypothetical protein GCM10010251_38980 [Streptomyces aurantiogriseus]
MHNGHKPKPGVTPTHWFEGSGMVHGIRLRDGRAEWYRDRWVRTPALNKAPCMTDRGPDLTAGAAGTAGTAGTHVIEHAGRLQARLRRHRAVRGVRGGDGDLRGETSGIPYPWKDEQPARIGVIPRGRARRHRAPPAEGHRRNPRVLDRRPGLTRNASWALQPRRRTVRGGPAHGIDGLHVRTFEPTTKGGALVTPLGSWAGAPVEADPEGMRTALEGSLLAWLGALKDAAERRGRG